MRPLLLACLAFAVALEESFHTVADKFSDVRSAGEALLEQLPTEGGGNIEAVAAPLPELHETAAAFIARGGFPGGEVAANYIYVGWAAPGSVMPEPEEGEAYGEFLARGGLLYEGPNGEHLPASHVFDGTNWIPA